MGIYQSLRLLGIFTVFQQILRNDLPVHLNVTMSSFSGQQCAPDPYLTDLTVSVPIRASYFTPA